MEFVTLGTKIDIGLMTIIEKFCTTHDEGNGQRYLKAHNKLSTA